MWVGWNTFSYFGSDSISVLASNCAALQTEVSVKRRGHFEVLLTSHHMPRAGPNVFLSTADIFSCEKNTKHLVCNVMSLKKNKKKKQSPSWFFLLKYLTYYSSIYLLCHCVCFNGGIVSVKHILYATHVWWMYKCTTHI